MQRASEERKICVHHAFSLELKARHEEIIHVVEHKYSTKQLIDLSTVVFFKEKLKITVCSTYQIENQPVCSQLR